MNSAYNAMIYFIPPLSQCIGSKETCLYAWKGPYQHQVWLLSGVG